MPAIGNEIGAIACALEPTGVMVEADPDIAAAVETTRALIEGGHKGPIFEATFTHQGVLVRVDALTPDGQGGWTLAEVKSTTGVKDYHHGDLATQIWVLNGAGVNLSSAAIRHINRNFVLAREGDYRGLFMDTQLMEALEPIVAGREALVDAAREVLAGEEPEIDIGGHCHDPFDCEFAHHCGKDAPPGPEWPIALLPRTGAKLAAQWAVEGVLDLLDVPEGAFPNPVHDRVHRATRSGVAYHDVAGAVAATEGWAWPRAYLDFETIALAAPRWIGSRPFQAIPFQFSCHLETPDGGLRHSGFLSVDGTDPRRACAEALVAELGHGQVGSIIAYNAAFERSCIRGLAAHCPELAAELEQIAGRIVDLLPVARDHYYHRDQRGSWSIKAVLPTLAPELAYDGLEVKDGQAAQLAWQEAVQRGTTAARRAEIARALELYCQRDTLAMVVILQRLTGRCE